jgi:uncharacterized membrane protein
MMTRQLINDYQQNSETSMTEEMSLLGIRSQVVNKITNNIIITIYSRTLKRQCRKLRIE